MTTKAEQSYMNKVAGLGCLICGAPACIHHVRRYGEKRKNSKIAPLCYYHHQGVEGIHFMGKKRWEAKYMTQDNLLKMVEESL